MARNVGEDANVEIEILAEIRSHALQSHYLTQLLTHDYKNFRQLLLNQGHHPIIHCNTAIFHINVHLSMVLHAFILVLIQIFVRFTKLSLPLVWKRFYWFIPSFSFLSCVRIFMYFLLSLLANNACWTWKYFKVLLNLYVFLLWLNFERNKTN